MSDLVNSADIERLVGARRHPRFHLGRADSTEDRVYVLHSTACKAFCADLRRCEYSIALDRGIDIERWWTGRLDRTVMLSITSQGDLIPFPLPSDAKKVTA